MWTGVEKVFSGIWDGIKSMFGKAINWMICKLNGFIKIFDAEFTSVQEDNQDLFVTSNQPGESLCIES